MPQRRGWLKAAVIFSLTFCCLFGLLASWAEPPRTIFNGGGMVMDAKTFCEFEAGQVTHGLTPDSPEYRRHRVAALIPCYAMSTLDVSRLGLQLLASALLGLVAWLLWSRR